MKKILSAIFIISISASTMYFVYQKEKRAKLAPLGYGYKNPTITKAKGEIGNFSLLDHNGDFHEFYRYSDKKAIVFISQGNDCPIIQKFTGTLNELKKKYEAKNIAFFMINANQQDSREQIIEEAKKYGIEFPILLDPSQLVTESLGITRTSEAIVIDPNGFKLVYRGAISDRLDYGVDKQTARNNYLDHVLTNLLENKKIDFEAPPAKGCLITFTNKDKISYEKDVAPILINKCLNCHADNGNFLPKFSNYDKLKSWVAMSKETILTDRMPPFSADGLYGKYANDISLTSDEKRTLVKWIDQGAPKEKNASDPLIGYKVIQKNNFHFTEPIYEASMSAPHKIPAGGEIEYQYFQLGGPIPKDIWTKGYWTKSTNPRQLHHESLFVVSHPLKFYEDLARKNFTIDETKRKLNTDGDVLLYTLISMEKYEYKFNEKYTKFQVWGAGRPQPFQHTKRVGAHLPKDAYLILETHYMGTGREETEQTKIEFYGYDKKPDQMDEIFNMTLSNANFEIPPMTKKYIVESREWPAKKNILLRSFLGHLHMRGTAIKVVYKEPDAKEFKTLISIPNYNFGWQTGAALTPTEPIAIKKGTILKGICQYDNSPQNPFNPDPTKTVHMGQRVDRTEMCKFNIAYTIDRNQ